MNYDCAECGEELTDDEMELGGEVDYPLCGDCTNDAGGSYDGVFVCSECREMFLEEEVTNHGDYVLCEACESGAGPIGSRM
jgi:DNA-directed RNA polymerase subunit RPC12/RpoP